MSRIGVVGLCLAALFLTACTANQFHDNQVYVVERGTGDQAESFVGWLDVQGTDPFTDTKVLAEGLGAGQLLLSVAPDGQSIYVMTYAIKPRAEVVLQGALNASVNLYRVNPVTKERQLIAEQIPFVVKAAWNKSGELVVFVGGNHLTIYDARKGSLILSQELAEESVVDFFWSPLEDNKLYIEQPDVTGGGVYYVDSQKKVELYETREKIYPKALLEAPYYYATQWRSDETAKAQEQLTTVLIDDTQQVVKVIGRGSYKDHYRDKVLLLGDDHFSLYYVADINQVSQGVYLTTDYVYDAKFIADGRVAYIVKDSDEKHNVFQLVVTDGQDQELWRAAISGSSLLLSPDGRTGYSSGSAHEVFDLVALQKISSVTTDAVREESLLQTLSGAAVVYGRLTLGDYVAQAELDRYFVDQHDPAGLARTELGRRLRVAEETPVTDNYQVRLSPKNWQMASDNRLATCAFLIEGRNSQGQSIKEQVVWDLVKKNRQWYVLGLSTFNQSPLKGEVLSVVQPYLRAQFPGMEVVVDQVQFWRKDAQQLAISPEDASAAKVTAIEGSIVVWLERGSKNSWQIQQVLQEGRQIYPR